MLELQETAKERRRNVVRSARAAAAKPSSSSSESYESDPGKAYMKKGQDPEEQKEKAEDPKEQIEKAKDPEEQIKKAKDPEEQIKKAKDLEEHGEKPEEAQEQGEKPVEVHRSVEDMSIAEVVKSMFRLDDIDSLLEEEKINRVNNILSTLEQPVHELPEMFGIRLQETAEFFKDWMVDLDEVVKKTEDDIKQNSQDLEQAREEREEALAELAQAQLKQAMSESKIEKAQTEAETLQEGLQTAQSVLSTSFEVVSMLKEVVSQLELAVAENDELKRRFFHRPEPATPSKNPQLEMLKALMRKAKENAPSTPAASVAGTEKSNLDDESAKKTGKRKEVKGTDKPSEPKEPPRKVRPEAKAVPSILKRPGAAEGKVEKLKARRTLLMKRVKRAKRRKAWIE